MENGVVTLPKITRYNGEMKMTMIFLSTIKGAQEADIVLPNGKTVKGIKVYTSPTDYFKSPISTKVFAAACAHALQSGEAVEIAPSDDYLALTSGKASNTKVLKAKW